MGKALLYRLWGVGARITWCDMAKAAWRSPQANGVKQPPERWSNEITAFGIGIENFPEAPGAAAVPLRPPRRGALPGNATINTRPEDQSTLPSMTLKPAYDGMPRAWRIPSHRSFKTGRPLFASRSKRQSKRESPQPPRPVGPLGRRNLALRCLHPSPMTPHHAAALGRPLIRRRS